MGLPKNNSYASELWDREGNLWLGTAKGLVRLKRSSFHLVVEPGYHASTLSSSPDDSIVWLDATSSYQMVHFRNGHIDWRVPVSANLTAAYRDSEGTVWFGSDEGISRLNGRSLILTRFPRELSSMETQAVLRDRTGALWCSIRRRGVFRYSDGEWRKNGGLEGLPQEPAIAMANDARGRIWLVYANARVGLVNGRAARTLGVSDGVPDANVTAIGTRGEHIWIGSDDGLYWFDGARFIALHVRNDSALRGLWGIVEASSGDVWTAGVTGIAHLTAGQIERAKKSGRLDEAARQSLPRLS